VKIIDEFIEKIKTTQYEYICYDGKKSTTTILSRFDNSATMVMRQILLEFMQKNVIDAKLENEGLKQRIMVLEACVNNSNFAPIIKKHRATKPNQ